MNIGEQKHIPVMLNEVLDYLEPQNGKIYIDATFGNGGYSSAILEKAKDAKLIAFDRDENVKPRADEIAKNHKNFTFINDRFSNLAKHVREQNIGEIDGIVFDLGVSSMQIDNEERGFSFKKDGPLDMRMGKNTISAFEIVNQYDEQALADIIYQYGEEKKSRRISKFICEARVKEQITTTAKLAEIVRKAIGKGKSKIDPATKTFQAIRVAVNEELQELKEALEASLQVLGKGGKIIIVTFQGLEDKIIKAFFKKYSGNSEKISRYSPNMTSDDVTQLKKLTNKAIKVSDVEASKNSRARSAKLRAYIKL